MLLDRAGRVVLVNQAAARLSGLGAEAKGRDFFRQLVPSADLPLGGTFRRAMEEGGALDTDSGLALTLEDGSSVDVRVRMRGLVLEGEPFAVLVIDDNTRLKEAERAMTTALTEARDQALRDPLTGLFNRRYVESVMPGEISRAQRYRVPLSFLVVDVDHFKSINDRFGHPVGDQVLIHLAKVMGRMRRVSDTCARIGGEEFAIALPHTSAAAAQAAAERLLRVVRALRFEEEPGLRVTVSIGVATTPWDLPPGDADAQVKRLFARADEALYEAKRTGRDRTVVGDP